MFGGMNPFSMVVIIVLIVFGTKIWRTHLMMKARMGRSDGDQALIGSMQSQIDRLTDRIQVLERLLTDDDRRLSREIDRLRTDRPSL